MKKLQRCEAVLFFLGQSVIKIDWEASRHYNDYKEYVKNIWVKSVTSHTFLNIGADWENSPVKRFTSGTEQKADQDCS